MSIDPVVQPAPTQADGGDSPANDPIAEAVRRGEIWHADPLHAELAPYLFTVEGLGEVLKHPLVEAVPYFDMMGRYLNLLFAQQTRLLEKARQERNWSRIIGLHTKPWRINALCEIAHEMEDEDYWRIVASTWTGVENIHEFASMWERLWTSDRPRRECAMDEFERDALAAMPERLTIYRGVQHEDDVYGLSWTLNRDVATWFARRWTETSHRPSLLATGSVSRANVLAYLHRRQVPIGPDYDMTPEDEIVALSDDIDFDTVERIQGKRRRS